MRYPRNRVAGILLLASGTTFGASWQQINSGLPAVAAGVRALAVDPKTPSTIYASTANGGVFKTVDGGDHWLQLRGLATVSSLILDPSNSSTLYASTGHGVEKSVDGGDTFSGADNGLTGSSPSLVADSKTPSTLYALTGPGLFKSTDGAQTWNPVAATFYASKDASSPLTNALFFVQAIPVFDPVNPTTIYLPFNDTESFTLFRTAHLLKSTDDGVSWNTVGTGIPADVSLSTLAIDPTNPSFVYATYSGAGGWGLIKSTDGGKNFSTIDTGLPAYNTGSVLAISPTSPATVYTGYVDFSLHRGRLVKSEDQGTSWKSADAGLTFFDIRTLVVDPVNPSTIYAGVGGAGEGVFKSVDRGANWSNLVQFQINPPAFPTSPAAQAEPAAINSLVIGFANPAILYAGTSRIGGGCVYTDSFFFKSTDGGGSWSGVTNLPIGGCGFFFSPLVVVLDPSNLDDLYVAGGGDCGGAFLENTSDGAASWTTRGSGFASTVNSLVIDPTNPAVLYAATPEGAFKTTNGGMDWTNMGLTGGVSVIAIDQAGSRTLYAATGGSYSHPGFSGMFKSTDGGANWTPIDNGLDVLINDATPVTALAIALDTSTLYAATSGKGVYKSIDGGANWVPFNQGLSSLDVRGLALAPKTPMTLYAVTSAGSFRFIDEAPPSASALLPIPKVGRH